MKKLFLIPFVLFIAFWSCGSDTASDSLDWETNLNEAVKKAKQENKAVLVNFTGSDWCKWCIKLSDEVFSKAEFEKYAEENLILVRVDFPRYKEQSRETQIYNQNLAREFGVRGYPTIIIINSEGKAVAKTGYQPGGAVNYIKHIESYL